MNKKKRIKICIYIILLLSIIILTNTLLPNDAFYNIKNGEYIIKNGFDFMDHFSIHDLPYRQPHWLYDIIIYKIYDLFGFFGIWIITIIISFLISSLIYKSIEEESKTEFFALLGSFLFTILFAGCVAARPYLVTGFLFLIEYIMLKKYFSQRNDKIIYFLPLISLLIANLHYAVIPFFYVLFLPFLVSHYFSKTKLKLDFLIFDKNKKIAPVYVIIVVSFFISLINPSGISIYSYFYKQLIGGSLSLIEEHLPATILTAPAFYIFVLFFIVLNISLKLKYSLSDFFLVIGTIFMSFLSLRNTLFVYLFGIPILIISILKSISEDRLKLYERFFYLLFCKLNYVLIFAFFILVFVGKDNNIYIDEKEYPIDASKYILQNLDYKDIRLYNQYDFGSYLLFENIPVFIDSRSDLYTKPFNNKQDIFKDYIYINGREKEYENLFDYYHFTHVILKKNSLIEDDFRKKFIVLYEDNYFVLFDLDKIPNSY